MKRTALFLMMMLTGAIMVNAQSTWKADPAHSNINFVVTHLLISEVTGKFGEFEIVATADDAFAQPEFTVEIPVTSVNTGIERRDNHLRSDDFFAVETHPTMSFKQTSFEKTGEKTFKLGGDLTLRGITKPVTLEGKLNGVITDQRSQKLKAGLKLTGTLDRKQFEVGMGGFPVGDEVELVVNLQMAQQ